MTFFCSEEKNTDKQITETRTEFFSSFFMFFFSGSLNATLSRLAVQNCKWNDNNEIYPCDFVDSKFKFPTRLYQSWLRKNTNDERGTHLTPKSKRFLQKKKKQKKSPKNVIRHTEVIRISVERAHFSTFHSAVEVFLLFILCGAINLAIA